ncbi:MAG: Uma2 family endonuclease [Eubacteriales bacterium]|nr:Uma2 family endonuclease [Eubacteriales bacterium]
MPLFKEEYTKEEKINGVIYAMSQSPNYQHGIVDGNIYSIIKAGLKGSLCLAFMENLDYKYHAQESNDYVIPDIMIICDRKHLKGGSYTGTPRFIVETLSPATALRDMTVKKEIYQAAGVEEYWIISPKERAVQIYYLENGKYDLKNSYILQDNPEEDHYNADTVVTLKDFSKISMTLAEMFENVE